MVIAGSVDDLTGRLPFFRLIDSGRGEGMVVLALFEEILAQLWRSS